MVYLEDLTPVSSCCPSCVPSAPGVCRRRLGTEGCVLGSVTGQRSSASPLVARAGGAARRACRPGQAAGVTGVLRVPAFAELLAFLLHGHDHLKLI